ncbi:MAG TPA: sialate O-acetylesterase [Humisphaera sp.]
MKAPLALLAALLLWTASPAPAADVALTEPTDYQVFQRATRAAGEVRLRGQYAGATAVEARIVPAGGGGTGEPAWQKAAARFDGPAFDATLPVPAGGWYRLEVRLSKDGAAVGSAVVEHVGVGEVFVVAGQSNSANHGEEKQTTRTKRVAAFDGKAWRLADDPQPGASGKGGSFLPPFADAIAERFDVPVGLIGCGIGATSVREWLPKGATFPNPPTIEGRVGKRPDGTWESKGAAFATLVERMRSAGPRGFRAVLWHQGESDANQKDPTRTLPGKLYRAYMEQLIRESGKLAGWDAPWFVAQVSYHVPGDEASPDIRDAQAALWKDGVALQGPDSDALKGDLRERGGKGVHFSGKGLRAHAAAWADKVGPWLEKELAREPNRPAGGAK